MKKLYTNRFNLRLALVLFLICFFPPSTFSNSYFNTGQSSVTLLTESNQVGGEETLLVGLEYPDRVLKLAVMDGIPFPRPQYSSWELRSFSKKGSILGKALVNWFPGISSQIARIKGFYRGHSIPKEVLKEFKLDGKSKTNQISFLCYFQNFYKGQTYFEEQVKNLKTEVLVIWGRQDRFINKKLGIEIADRIPNSKLKIIDKAGHYVHMDKPKELTSIVTEFIRSERV